MKNRLKVIASYGTILLVALIMAMNYQLFVFPNRFAPSGLNGLFTMVQHVFDFKLSYASIMLNLPLAIVAFFITSRARAIRSFVYVAAFSLFLMILDRVDLNDFQYATTSSTILGPAVAGMIAGGCGYLMHKMNAGLGGTEFIAAFISKYRPDFNFFTVIFALDSTVALLSYFVYGYQIEPVLLCILYCYFSSTIRDNLNRRHQSAIRCEIVTENPDELCDAIIHQLHHTATRFPAEGIFSGAKKTVLVCVVNSSQVAELTKLVASYPHSFVTLGEVSTVLGNFKRLDSHGKPEVRILDDGIATK